MLVQHAAGSGTPVDAVTTPDFFALNVKLAYEFTILRTLTLQLNAGVQNLFDSYQSDFDQGWERDSGYVYGPSLPRNLVRRGENPLLRTVAATHEKKGDVRTTRLLYRSPPANPTYPHRETAHAGFPRSLLAGRGALVRHGSMSLRIGRNVLPPISVRRQGATSAWNHVQAAV